jgi:hypothetical protein|tara:strand:+ start:4675 stop:5028 length:354 start_codon:yes stop_codon:yes gene_type:complete
MTVTYNISSNVYYNSIDQCYRKIIVIDRYPEGPLQDIVKALRTPKLSSFQTTSSCCPTDTCAYAVYNPNNVSELLFESYLPLLITYLETNGYTINYDLTNTVKSETNNVILYFSYEN